MIHVGAYGLGAIARPSEARRLAPLVQAELLRRCCQLGHLCFPQHWPMTQPPRGGLTEEQYASARQDASALCMRYNRGLVGDFQEAAGLERDGNYGPETRGALRAYGISNPYPSLYGGGETEYRRPSGWIWAVLGVAAAAGGYMYWRR